MGSKELRVRETWRETFTFLDCLSRGYKTAFALIFIRFFKNI